MSKELEQAAREWLKKLTPDNLIHFPLTGNNPNYSTSDLLTAFALAKLRQQFAELERRGYLYHAMDCNIPQKRGERIPVGPNDYEWRQLPCNCGLDDLRRELEDTP